MNEDGTAVPTDPRFANLTAVGFDNVRSDHSHWLYCRLSIALSADIVIHDIGAAGGQKAMLKTRRPMMRMERRRKERRTKSLKKKKKISLWNPNQR